MICKSFISFSKMNTYSILLSMSLNKTKVSWRMLNGKEPRFWNSSQSLKKKKKKEFRNGWVALFYFQLCFCFAMWCFPESCVSRNSRSTCSIFHVDVLRSGWSQLHKSTNENQNQLLPQVQSKINWSRTYHKPASGIYSIEIEA